MIARRPRRSVAQINVVPYIDVMMVLLVIFMVTAPMMTPGQVDLPSVAKSHAVAVNPFQVTIHAEGRIVVRDAAHGGDAQAVDMQQLSDLVVQMQQQGEQPVVIAADKNVRYESVMRVMSLMQRLHVKRLGLLAVPASTQR